MKKNVKQLFFWGGGGLDEVFLIDSNNRVGFDRKRPNPVLPSSLTGVPALCHSVYCSKGPRQSDGENQI